MSSSTKVKHTNKLFFIILVLWLLIWSKNLSYSFEEIVNSKVFGAEMITILCAGIGVAWITAYFLVKEK